MTSIKVMIGFFSLNTRHTHQTGLRPGKARSPGDNFKWTQKMKRKCRKQNALMYVEHTLRSVNDVTEGITQETPMGASWVIPRKVDKMV